MMNKNRSQPNLRFCILSMLTWFVATIPSANDSTPCAGQVAETPSTESTTSQQESEIKSDFLGDPLPPHALIRLGTNRFNPSNGHFVTLSADDQIAITFGRDLMAWDATSGKLLWQNTPNIPRSGIITGAAAYGSRPLCRMPISGKLVTAGQPGAIVFWDFVTGEKTSLQTETVEQFKSIDVSPDESLIALGGEKLLLVCDRSGKEKYHIPNHPQKGIEARNGPGMSDRLTFGGEFSYGRFTPDGKSLALVNSENPQTIQVLDAASGDVKQKIETTGRVVRIDFSKDSQHVLTTERDIAARMYDLETGKLVWKRVFSVPGMDERYTTDIQVSPNADLVAVGTAIGEDQRIQLLDSKTGESVGALKGHTWKPWCLQFTADGRQLFSTGWDCVIRRWDIEKREQIRIENSQRASSVCAMAPDGRSIAFCDDSGSLHIVDIASGKKLKTFAIKDTTFGQVIYSQDCQRLAAGGSSKNDIHVYVWNLVSGEILHHWEWPKGRDTHSNVEALSFSRDANRLVAAVFRQSACYVFDLLTDKQLGKVRHGMVYGACMSLDGNQFVSAGWDKNIRLWDCETGEALKTVEVADANNARAETRMYGVLYSPDGKSIASLEMGGHVRTWNLELEPINTFSIKSRPVYGSFNYSRNGLWLGVGQMNGEVNVYDVHTGDVVWDLAKHAKSIYNVDFGADDRTLLTGGEDGVCYLWDLNAAANKKSYDFEKLAKDLVGESPRDAFNAYQCLAAEPDQALPAIQTAIASTFANWGEPDDEKLAELHHRVNRVAMWLAETEAPGAGELLDNILKNSPNGTIKKTLFLASRQRERFLERIGDDVDE